MLDSGYFGSGIYFGYTSDYANLYVRKYHRQKSQPLRMLRCLVRFYSLKHRIDGERIESDHSFEKVLSGRSYQVNEKKDKRIQGEGCRTGFESHVSVQGNELVVFDPDQILITHVIEYSETLTQQVAEEDPIK